MALPIPSSDKGAWRVDVLGFPVSMHPAFLLLGGLLAFSAGLDLPRIVVWLAVVLVSVLAHELGHAFVMRSAGASPTITLYALGGVTRGVMPGTPSRGRRLAVSLAGPAAGLALGALVLGIAVYVPVEEGGLAEYALGAALFANVGWGVLNLLPILPLDGGHVLMTLLPGDEERRFRIASIVSIVVGGGVTLIALSAGFTFAALLTAYFVLGNVMALRGDRPDPAQQVLVEVRRRFVAGDDEGAAAVAREASLRDPRFTGFASQLTAAVLLFRGDLRDAKDELLALPPGSVEPMLEAAVLLADGHDALGREKLRAAVTGGSGWGIRALTRVLLDRGEDLRVALDGLPDPDSWRIVGAAAYDVARIQAQAGDTDRALAALRAALDVGFDDVARIDADPDLAPLRALPEFAALRAGR